MTNKYNDQTELTFLDALRRRGLASSAPLFSGDSTADSNSLGADVLPAETCAEVAQLTKDYPDISDSVMLRITPHLEKCEECRKKLKSV